MYSKGLVSLSLLLQGLILKIKIKKIYYVIFTLVILFTTYLRFIIQTYSYIIAILYFALQTIITQKLAIIVEISLVKSLDGVDVLIVFV